MAEVTSVEVRQGTADETGPVRLEITPTPSSGNPSSGCLSGVPASLITDLRAHPDGYYLNVATNEFPKGAARGQFFGTPTGSGGIDWFLYLAGAAVLVAAAAVGFLLGRRTTRRGTFTA
jgi:hypothetical protein